MRVLLVSHTAQVSGGERSLLDLLAALPDDIEVVACSPPGRLAHMLGQAGVPTLPLPAFDASFRLSVRHTPLSLLNASRAALLAARHSRRTGAQVVHANSVRAGLVGVVAARLGSPRPVVHLRDRVPASRSGTAVRRVVNSGAAALVANSAATAAEWGPTALPVTVARGPVDLRTFDPALHERAAARTSLGLDAADDPVLAVVAQITPWKGQDLAIEVTAQLRTRWPGIQLLISGDVEFADAGSGFDNSGYSASLRALVSSLGLERNVRFLGRRDDVPTVLAASDLVMVPSWFEPMGRVVLEGLAMGLPVVATRPGGPVEMIDDPRLGLLLPPRSPGAWAAGVEALLERSPDADSALRAFRRSSAKRFDARHHADAVVAAWRGTLATEDWFSAR
jgi:glycosyltransferase involved in cell wall biosynthesis